MREEKGSPWEDQAGMFIKHGRARSAMGCDNARVVEDKRTLLVRAWYCEGRFKAYGVSDALQNYNS